MRCCSRNSESQNIVSERDRSNEPGNLFESCVQSVFRIAVPQMLGDHCLMVTKIIFFIKGGLITR